MTGDATKPRQSKMAAALQLAEHGFPVFPLIPNDKRPLIKGWQRLATATDIDRIRDWWADEPDANIGISTERLYVVDVDPRKGGSATFSALSMTEDIPDTLASVTAGGGAHLIFALPHDVTVSGGNDLLGQGVDVKSHGGFIVAPGSTINGNSYRWVPGHDPNQRKPAVIPDWAVARAHRPAERSTQAGETVAEEDDAAIARAEHWLSKHAPEAVEGQRDNTAFAVAAKLYDFGLQPATTREYLAQWNEGWCQPPLDNDDLDRIANSAAKNRQTAIGSRHPDAPGFDTHDIDTTKAPDLDLPDEKPKRAHLYHLDFNTAAEQALTHVNQPLVEGLLDRQAMSVLYGESNSGKTFVMLDIAFAVAAGRPWSEDKETHQGAVVYVAAEGGKGVLKRIRALKERHDVQNNVPLYVIPCPVDLLRPDADLKPLVQEIKAIAAAYGVTIELVVIDTLSRAIAGGNENDSQDMGALVRHLDLIRAHTAAHVAVVHHTGKDKAKGARGHSLLRAATDTEIEIDERTLTVTKQRDMEGGLSLGFSLQSIDLGTDRDGRAVKSCTVAWGGPGPDEPLPLTSDEQGLVDALMAALSKRDKGDISGCFDIRFAMSAMAESSRFRVKNPSGKSLARQTASDWMTELTEKGAVKKAMRGQWVMAIAGNAGNAESVQDKMPEMPGTHKGPASGKSSSPATGLDE